MLYFIFVSSKISRICNSKIVSSPGERERERETERERMHFPVIIELYSLSASLYSTEGAPTLSLHLRPVWTDQLAFCDFIIRKILSVS